MHPLHYVSYNNVIVLSVKLHENLNLGFIVCMGIVENSTAGIILLREEK